MLIKEMYGGLSYSVEIITGEYVVKRDEAGNIEYGKNGQVVCVPNPDPTKRRNKFEEIMKISALVRQRINAVIARNDAAIEKYGKDSAVLEPIPESSQVITDIIYEYYV